MASTKTLTIIVSGSSGSGKTTLANVLKQSLGYPLISKDLFKDVLMDVWPPVDRTESKRVGAAAWSVMYSALDAMIGSVPGVILEANFQRGTAEGELRPRLDQCSGILLHCTAPREQLLDRVQARQGDPERLAGHFDQQAIPDLLGLLDSDGYRLGDLGVPVIEVDTSDGYRPDLARIVSSIESIDRS